MAFSFEAALRKTDIFAMVNQAHLSKFAEIVSPQTYIEGQVVTHQGDLGTGLYIITKGKVDVIANQGESNEVKIATLGEGDMFGDMALLLEQPRSSTIVATEATECFVLHRADFKRLAMENPEVLWNMLEIMAERVTRLDEELTKD